LHNHRAHSNDSASPDLDVASHNTSCAEDDVISYLNGKTSLWTYHWIYLVSKDDVRAEMATIADLGIAVQYDVGLKVAFVTNYATIADVHMVGDFALPAQTCIRANVVPRPQNGAVTKNRCVMYVIPLPFDFAQKPTHLPLSETSSRSESFPR
jgi:hypothetical protein